MLPEQVEAFSERFEEVVAESLELQHMTPEVVIDSEIEFSDIKFSFYNILQQMRPFGPGNRVPIFLARGVENTGHSKVVKEKHIRFVLQQGRYHFTGIGFGLAPKFELLSQHRKIDLVFRIDENHWNNNRTLQLHVIDFAPSEHKG